jgi:hypothetical protein
MASAKGDGSFEEFTSEPPAVMQLPFSAYFLAQK